MYTEVDPFLRILTGDHHAKPAASAFKHVKSIRLCMLLYTDTCVDIEETLASN